MNGGRILALLVCLTFLHVGCVNMLLPEKMQLVTGGRYSEAEKLMEQKIPDMSAAKSRDLIYLCYSYAKLKKYNQMFNCLNSLERNIRNGDRSGYKDILDSVALFPSDLSPMVNLLRAEAYIDLGDYRNAVKSAEEAYRLAEGMQWSSTDRTIVAPMYYRIATLRTVALAYALSGEREKAVRFASALENLDVGFRGYSLFKRERFTGLARVYMALGMYEKIQQQQDLFIDALSGFGEAMVGVNMFTFSELPKKFVITKSLYETGRIADAKKGYDELLARPDIEYNGELYWPILFDRGRIAQGEGDLKGAIDFYRRAIDVIEAQRTTIHTEAAKIGFVGDKQSVYHSMIRVLFDTGDHAQAFDYVERSKARALVDILAGKKDFAVKTGNAAEIGAVLARSDSAEADSLNPVSDNPSRLRSVSLKARLGLREKSSELASLVTVSSPAMAEIKELIPKDETLVEYYYNGKDMYAFVLSSRGFTAHRLSSTEINDEIKNFRRLLETPGSSGYEAVSKRLYLILIDPIEKDLIHKNLIIVPHGAIHYLPINALHDGRRYMIEKYNIRIMPSAAALKFLRKDKIKRKEVLVFGNPDLGNPDLDLAYAQNEAMAISRLRPGSRVFVRKQATESALRKYAPDFSLIHFATHGRFDPESPLKSAILLARDAENDGMLTVDKLYSMRLDSDLVTLSACETGLGKVSSGDDVVGLSRGFLYAGSRSIVASLWKVDDLATSQIMSQFYANLEKMDKSEALHQAQLKGKDRYPHPFYWASFQLTGSR